MFSLVSVICLGADNYFIFFASFKIRKTGEEFQKIKKNSAFPSRVMPNTDVFFFKKQTFVMSEARGLVVKVTEKTEKCCFSVRRL